MLSYDKLTVNEVERWINMFYLQFNVPKVSLLLAFKARGDQSKFIYRYNFFWSNCAQKYMVTWLKKLLCRMN